MKPLDVYNCPTRIVGFLFSTPFCLLVFIYPVFFILRKYVFGNGFKRGDVKFPFYEFAIIFSAMCLNAGFLFLWFIVIGRYVADFAVFLILLSCIIWFYFDLALEKSPVLRQTLRFATVFLALITILNGMVFSLTAESFTLENQRYKLKKIESLLNPVSKLISRFTRTMNPY
ncbi:MAG: hypothetical protein HYZ79_05705 [Candidatus Melainabacteria bacterium]|nr:hypothetical protein [Candidatus Melainabacteria bacterium]